MDSKKEYQHGDYLINSGFRKKLESIQQAMQPTLKKIIKEYGDEIFLEAREGLFKIADKIDKSIDIYNEGNNTLSSLMIIFNMALIHLDFGIEWVEFREYQEKED